MSAVSPGILRDTGVFDRTFIGIKTASHEGTALLNHCSDQERIAPRMRYYGYLNLASIHTVCAH